MSIFLIGTATKQKTVKTFSLAILWAAAEAAEGVVGDTVNSMHGLYLDLRCHEVYTINDVSMLDVDNGLLIKVLAGEGDTGPTRYRYWMHITDVDRWSPRDFAVLKAAERKGTSLYLPTGPFGTFPPM